VNALAGTRTLTLLALRRSRIILTAWVAMLVLFAAYSARATVDLYPSLASRVGAADAINRSPALVAVYGRVYDPSSLGALAMIKTGSLGAVFVAILTAVLVVRHTRGDEETGRGELVGGTAVGRRAPLAAALTVAAVLNAALTALTAAGLTAAGLPLAGSVAFGLAWGGVGLAFAAVAAVAAQLTTSARTATAISAVVLAVVYLLRAVGDASEGTGLRWLTWLSPVGWAQQFRPYAGDRWWVLAITLGSAALLAGAAFVLAARRDLGAGLMADRSGPASASPSLRSPLALAWRLHRGALLGWAVGFALVGVLIGGLAANVGSFLNNPSARDFITTLGGEKGLIDAFLALELAFAGIVASAYGIQVVMRLRAEETGLRADPVLATGVGRVRWALSHITIALAGTTLLMVLAGAGAGLVRAAQTGAAGEGVRVFAAALVQLPAAWVLAAIVVAAFGLAPRFTGIGWAALAGFVVLGELGPLLKLSHWVMDASPFAHVPKLPGATFTAAPMLALIAVAALLAAAGLAGLRRRDVGGA
jgi:ABC-2 type transport system permease protein